MSKVRISRSPTFFRAGVVWHIRQRLILVSMVLEMICRGGSVTSRLTGSGPISHRVRRWVGSVGGGGVVPHSNVLGACVHYRDSSAIRVGPPVPLLHPLCILQMLSFTEICLLLLSGVENRRIAEFLNWLPTSLSCLRIGLNFMRRIQTLQVNMLLSPLIRLAGGRIYLSMYFKEINCASRA